VTSPDPAAPLDRDRLLAALAGDRLARDVTVLASTGSTNADVAAAARAGAPEGTVVVAAEQREGRGRLQRRWSSPAGSRSMAVLLRPAPSPASWGWLPLLTGVAVVAGLRSLTAAGGVPLFLKWPNDVVVEAPGDSSRRPGDRPGGGPAHRKLAGILVERVDATTPAAVVGIGVNVTTDADDVAVPTATSVLLATGRALAREEVAAAILAELSVHYGAWSGCEGDADRSGLRAEYVATCATLGRRIRLELPDGDRHGEAVGIDGFGRLLVVDAAGGTTPYSSGEVVHLR
jgi:BirA family biotin operon repressor/biotin-[acetyl-CoA-carboxylase] ligase